MAKAASDAASSAGNENPDINKKRVRPPAQSGRYPRGKRAGTWMPRLKAMYQCQQCAQMSMELEVTKQKCTQLESALQASNQRCSQLAAAMGAANQKAAKSNAPCFIVRPAPTSWTSNSEIDSCV